MKQGKVLLAAMIATMVATDSNAQTTWGTGGTNTFTYERVGIGAMAVPTDAWLHIYGIPQPIPCPGGGTSDVFSIPELWIDRQLSSPLGLCGPAPTNLFQVSNTVPSFGGGTAVNILDVINSQGWLGINTSNPSAPLHVQGGTVINDGTLSLTRTTDNDFRNIVAASDNYGLNLLAGVDGTNTGIVLASKNNSTDPGQVRFIANTSVPSLSPAYNFLSYNGSAYMAPMVIQRNGFVGINTSNPGYQLTLNNGTFGLTSDGDAGYRWILGTSDHFGINIYSGTTGWDDGSGVTFNARNSAYPGQIAFVANTTTPSTLPAYVFKTNAGGSYASRMSIQRDGGVDIGTDNPIRKLDLRDGDFAMTRTVDDGYRWILGTSQNYGVNLFSGTTGWGDGSGVSFNGVNSANSGQVRFVANTSGSALSDVPAYLFQTFDGTTWSPRLAIKRDGRVIIGSDIMYNAPSGPGSDYNLYVSKGILTEKLKVANSGDHTYWSDFVFANDYKLMPLSKVEAYVKMNKHLPEIPSAKDVSDNGIDVMEMDAKLLQKIEELTLYVIEQQKEIENLKCKLGK